MRSLIYYFAAVAALVLSAVTHNAHGQYYDWGQEPASVKWDQVEGNNGVLVFPDYYRRQALRLMNYMDTLRSQVGYGYRHGPMKMPLVLHTQNFSQNGIVMLAPSRMEFIITPPASTFAFPWHKQLAVHEFRHAVQYGNTNRGFVRVLSWILGQQGSLVGMGQLPFWMVEGDAVLTETEFSTFGRGLQPSFTIDYRAILGEGIKYRPDKFFSGSYKDYLPDHYTLGYHMTRYTYDKYGENIWDKVAWFNSRNPYMIFPTTRALRKFYGTSTTRLFHETFEKLTAHWSSFPPQEDSPELIPTPVTSFTTYETPVAGPDGIIYALKTDLDRTTRIVSVDPPTGSEKVLARTGRVNTPLVLVDGKLWWTEERQSTFWEQRVNSILCWYDLTQGRKGTVANRRHTLFPAPSREGSRPAWVEYHKEGYYTLVTPSASHDLADEFTVHGLAYDRKTDAYYIIGLSDAGMWLGRVEESPGADIRNSTDGRNPGGVTIVNEPSYTTLANLRADNGRLLYTSIASGRDEAHIFDLDETKEYRVTASRYGSFSPAPGPGGDDFVVTTYTSKGYLLAVQRAADSPMRPQSPSSVPRSIFNPPGLEWDVMNIDTLTLTGEDKGRTVRRYRKAGRQFRFHSWAPFWFDPERLMDEDRFNVHFGATALSQNLLNSAFTTIGYKYTDAGSLFTAGLKFYALAPKFEIDAQYGTMDQSYRIPFQDLTTPHLKNHYVVTGRAFLPILVGNCARIQWLTPTFEVEHQNIKYYEFDTQGRPSTNEGVQKFRFSVSYTDNMRMAHRDFLPRFGYALRLAHTFTPLNDYFGGITSLFGRVYLPGILPHSSLMLRGALQKQESVLYNFAQKDIFPRGADFRYNPDRYRAFTVDYQLPVCYPDGGINSVLYFRRIRANVFYDHAYFRMWSGATWDLSSKKIINKQTEWKTIRSYGLELTFDMVPFRLPPNTNTSFTVSIYKPSDHKKPVFNAGLVLPL